MFDRFRPRLTFANVTSLLALLVALGGTGYAAVTINGSQLKDRSVAGKKLKKNTLGGSEINESKLGRVPSANLAVNTQKLGGTPASAYRTHCPSGMTLVGTKHDLCVDSTDRATSVNWNDGSAACASAGLRLPSLSEALEASFPNEHFWTDDIYNDSPGLYAWQWYGAGIDNASRSNLYNVRCVTTPTNL